MCRARFPSEKARLSFPLSSSRTEVHDGACGNVRMHAVWLSSSQSLALRVGHWGLSSILAYLAVPVRVRILGNYSVRNKRFEQQSTV